MREKHKSKIGQPSEQGCPLTMDYEDDNLVKNDLRGGKYDALKPNLLSAIITLILNLYKFTNLLACLKFRCWSSSYFFLQKGSLLSKDEGPQKNVKESTPIILTPVRS